MVPGRAGRGQHFSSEPYLAPKMEVPRIASASFFLVPLVGFETLVEHIILQAPQPATDDAIYLILRTMAAMAYWALVRSSSEAGN